MSVNNTNHSPEARLLAALAHASIVIQGIGMLIGVVVYIHQRDKSRYAAFQALQAAIYQLVAMIFVVGTWVVWTVCYTLSFIPMIPAMEASSSEAPPAIFWISMGSMCIPFGIMLVVGLYGIWGALRVWGGHDFRYAGIGRWLENSGMINQGES